jgi:hypothetical protein
MDLDVAEGADILLVKPALPGLDLIAAARARFDVPIAAYQVSGEFAMIAAASERGWLDERRAMTEGRYRDRPSRCRDRHHLCGGRSRDVDPGRTVSANEQVYVQALGPRLDPVWRRRTDEERHDDGCRFGEAEAAAELEGVRSIAYIVGRPGAGVDLLFWRMAPSIDALETAAAGLLRAGLGRWLTVRHSLIGRLGPRSTYVSRPTRSSRCSSASAAAISSSIRSRRAPSGTSSRRRPARA